jgi:putative DNA primase/helicase
MSEFTVDGADGQVKRAASKFALVAMAGELAIEYGIVPWPKGDAVKAAAEMFDAWGAGRGTVANDEPRQRRDGQRIRPGHQKVARKLGKP